MRLIFTKRAGKIDELAVERANAPVERIPCPKQGMIPHDMVHYAVEKTLIERGFLTRLAAGEAAGFAMGQEPGAEAIERLVETMQAETWSGPVPVAELIATYEHACAARGHAAIPVPEAAIDAVRREMAGLAAKWDAVPVNGSLVLTF
jgi:hypothetical protein